MEVKVQIPFHQLLKLVRQLSPTQKAKLQKELAASEKKSAPQKSSSLTERLLKGPVFTEDQIETIQETRKSINQWRTES